MSSHCLAVRLLAQEARGLLSRLSRVRPFALHAPMVAAAAVSPAALAAIEAHLLAGRGRLHAMVRAYLRWLELPSSCAAGPAEAQRRYAVLKLRFNAVIADFEIFADVLAQRSEHQTGVWVAGLDHLAADALAVPGDYYRPPPVICFLDRSHGAAIRRARTRMPAGGPNPVAIIRMPRERMVGSGIAASVVHEAGHQGAAMLGLVNSLRADLRAQGLTEGAGAGAWRLWDQWMSEILCDFWAVARLGIAASFGLMSVVSLPAPFVFRLNLDDPHPMPWLRVKLSCALGDALYPHPQWRQLADLWEQYYPPSSQPQNVRQFLSQMEAAIPAFTEFVANHRPESLRGRSLREALAASDRAPARLLDYFQEWMARPEEMRAAPPTLVFGVIGQAKAAGRIGPEAEAQMLADLLTGWALRAALRTATACAATGEPANRHRRPVWNSQQN